LPFNLLRIMKQDLISDELDNLSANPALNNIQNFKGTYPKQLWALFFSEMWERFCFYGMRGMLVIFMTSMLGMEEKIANLQYGATQAWVYAFTFIGGMIADKLLGFKKSLLWGGLLMIVGSIILSINPKEYFFLGIAFNIIGTGFFKPNISTMVGDLYRDGDSRQDAGFFLFYSGINIGALLGGYFCIAIAKGEFIQSLIPESSRWNVAFSLAAIVMTISLVTFLLTKKNLGPIGNQPENIAQKSPWVQYVVYALALLAIPLIMVMVKNTKYTDIFMMIIGPLSILFLIYEMTKLNKSQNYKLIAAFVFILFSVVFWAIFEQAGGSLSLFADKHLSNKLLGFITLSPTGLNNSANAFFVIAFAPLVGLFFLQLAKRKLDPNTVVKYGLGFVVLGLGFLAFSSIKHFANEQAIATLNVFTAAYLVVTFAELLISPVGLSLMTKLAPSHMQGFMMGMWFLASAYGQYVAGLFGSAIAPNATDTPMQRLASYTNGYYQFAWYGIIAGIVIIVISPVVKKLMQGVK
jgi:proton-dependent oligopeptide transporter, POT family